MRVKLYRGRYYAVWRERGNTRRVALRTADRGEAERQLAEIERSAAAPKDTIASIVEAYLKEKAHSAADPQRLRDSWKALQKQFGSLRPEHVTRETCRVYANARRKAGRSNGTIRKELSTLRAALRWHDPRTPAIFAFPPAPPPRERYLTREEYARLLEACASEHVRLFTVLALATAARSAALLDLKWSQIDFAAGLIRLGEGRGNKGRATVPMTESARQALERAQPAAMSDYVIEYAGKPVASIKRAFARAAERAGMPEVSPHVLRHTAASWMAQAGVPMIEIARYLGHSSTRVTEATYAHLHPDYLRRAAAALC